MASRGLAVGLIARRQAELTELCERIEAQGGTAAWATADVTDLDGLTAAIKAIESELGPPSILVANAGISGRSPTSDPDLSRIQKVMDVNFMGAIHATKAVLPHMMAQRGVTRWYFLCGWISGVAKSSAYSASKAAISTYWESLRVEVQPHGIAATTINPGYIQDPSHRQEQPPDALHHLGREGRKDHGQRNLGPPEGHHLPLADALGDAADACSARLALRSPDGPSRRHLPLSRPSRLRQEPETAERSDSPSATKQATPTTAR